MRKELDLYANLRPCISVPTLKTPGSRDNVDLLIVRENTEDLYVKREKMHKDPVLGDVAIAEKQISEYASTRIARVAFQQAATRSRTLKKDPLVTIVHKSNVLSLSDGLFRECALKVAKEFPSIKFEEQIVDSMLLKMIQHPERYDVIVAPNLYGDILSDGAAAFGALPSLLVSAGSLSLFPVGGLGLAPSANKGDAFVMVEPVHGSAPDIEGKGIANPIATIRAAALLLESVESGKFAKFAALINRAVDEVLNSAKALTPDLGGKASTKQTTDAILAALRL